MSKQIPLTQGKFAIVDDEDFDWLSQWKWRILSGRHTFYAQRDQRKKGKTQSIFMHRQILGLKYKDGIETDHKDHNGLNNQCDNLRIADTSQNQHNQRNRKKGTSIFKGVCMDRGKWQASISIRNKRKFLGCFFSELDAALAYDKVALKTYGQFACTNLLRNQNL